MDQSHGLGTWSERNEEIFRTNYPIHRACRDGDIDCLVSLLSAGYVDFFEEDDFYGWTPCHWASYFGKLPCLMRLLDSGASCDGPTERINQTPAHIAAYGGQSHCLKWLLHCGATLSRQLACLRRLVSMGGVGCDVPASRFSQTPVHLSAYAGHPHCLQWQLQSNCNFNVQDYLSETPCHKAARTGSMECISLLVSQGAKLDVRNNSGNTAAQVAASSGFTECANYLERAMQIQVQATRVYEEMRTPVTHPSAGLANPMSNPIVSERSSPPHVFQSPSGGNTLISVNRYHSNPHYISTEAAGLSATPSMTNGLNHNNNNQSEDCDMEMEDEAQGGNQYLNSNGAMEGATNGDVAFNAGTWNGLHIAGKKRGLEEVEQECFKRARCEEPSMPRCKLNGTKLNGWLHNNGHMGNHMTSHMRTPITESMVEHYASVSIQQGYDNMVMDNVTK